MRPPEAVADSLHLSLEICSEAPLHHENWPSDITVWLNGVEIGAWTSPGDFGDVRGLNIFGRHFGNYPQDIVLRLRYH
jgi:predicted transcriptional regulator